MHDRGGPSFIPIARPRLGEEEEKAAARVIRSGWVTQGPEVKAFEEEFATYVGAEHACAVSSCTAALHLALRAVGVGPGDEVITVSHSFIATANAIRYCGAKPVFIDIDPETFNLDPLLLERIVTPRSRAILCVHQMGMPCDLANVVEVARRHSLPLIEDAACAIGSEIRWNGRWDRIGRPHGDAACFSFHPRKLLTTGDGGMITTGRADWDAKYRLWRQHSMSVPDTVRHQATSVVFEQYSALGFNYRMTDIQAAVGREQLRRLPTTVARRRSLVERYRELLADVPGLGLPVEPAWARTNWQSFCVRLAEGVNQHAVMQHMLDAGVATRRGVMCAHREAAYQAEAWSCGEGPGACGCDVRTCRRLVESERAQDRAVILPLYHEMSDDELTWVADALRQACRNAARLSR